MAFWLEMLLWNGVVLLPGGLLLLPLIYAVHRADRPREQRPSGDAAASHPG